MNIFSTTRSFFYSLVFVVFLLFVGASFYVLNERIRDLSADISRMEKVKGMVPVSHSASSFATASTGIREEHSQKGFAWSDLKPQFTNTVVQVFSQVAEFNWLQPYRAPIRGQSSGSGFFINEDGYIITNAHVVNEARTVMIKVPALGKRQFEVEVVGLTIDRDLALLKVKSGGIDTIKATVGKIPYLGLCNSDKVHRADEVMALGYPLGQLSLKSTTGVISGWEHIMGNHLIQMDAAINPGSSGGPVLNKDGNVVGVSVAGIVGAQNVGYIIPSNDVVQFIDQIMSLPSADEKPIVLNKPFLGVAFCNSTEALTSYLGNPHPGGLIAVDVFEDGPLGKAGVKREDMLYSINGHRIDMYGEVYVPDVEEDKISVIDYAGKLNVGDVVELVYYRKGKQITTKAVLEAPDAQVWPLKKARLPGIDFDMHEYEIIGGLCIMPLTRNHLGLLLQNAPLLGKYIDTQFQRDKALIVTDVLYGSSAFRDKVVGPGVILDKVNDIEVKTLDDLRQAIKATKDNEFLKIETQEKFIIVFKFAEIIQEATKLAKENMYKLSPLMVELQALGKRE